MCIVCLVNRSDKKNTEDPLLSTPTLITFMIAVYFFVNSKMFRLRTQITLLHQQLKFCISSPQCTNIGQSSLKVRICNSINYKSQRLRITDDQQSLCVAIKRAGLEKVSPSCKLSFAAHIIREKCINHIKIRITLNCRLLFHDFRYYWPQQRVKKLKILFSLKNVACILSRVQSAIDEALDEDPIVMRSLRFRHNWTLIRLKEIPAFFDDGACASSHYLIPTKAYQEAKRYLTPILEKRLCGALRNVAVNNCTKFQPISS
ncbi:unnamed protein product, partial [Trichogramma brassicae]